jgi:hypothetical protein
MPNLGQIFGITTLSVTMATGGALIGVMWEKSRHPEAVSATAAPPTRTAERVQEPAAAGNPGPEAAPRPQARSLFAQKPAEPAKPKPLIWPRKLGIDEPTERAELDTLARAVAFPMPASPAEVPTAPVTAPPVPLREQFEDRERERRRRAALGKPVDGRWLNEQMNGPTTRQAPPASVTRGMPLENY